MADNDVFNFLDEDPNAAPPVEAQPEAPVEPTQEARQEEPSAAEEPKVEAPAEQTVEGSEQGTGETRTPPPGVTDEKQQAIPVTALLDERDRRQNAERKLQDLEQRMQQYAQSQQPQDRPDFFENPDQAMQAAIQNQNLRQSRFFAEQQYGADLVREAYEYFNRHPQESQQLLSHPSPFHAGVEYYKRQKFLAEVGDPDKWREQQREAIRQELMQESQQQVAAHQTQPSRPVVPPPSMASAPAAGAVQKPQGNAFDQAFPM